MAETEATTDEEVATKLLEQFKLDLLKLALRDDYQARPHVVITGLLDIATVLMHNGVQLEPAALPVLLIQIDRVRATVLRADRPGPTRRVVES
jgi:hypothetical protein